ncbi:MAG: nitrogen-fixing NifU domain protein [Candidatus Parvarchaeum acidophilus ARMAN-5]|jgi:nitrogen fixation NifU-like protein|uniref:Nitrogen-fixing NifU domain protein n=1 Tax=Candidatus Parvarchaeum acidophilus ARMAN-5 TaxID=662762 RepID=D6GV60_PARA5|nr:MAG: nitrogen-fixing NifU domain protein [Candidatus Parvarchaeum acidophilus ARMAN-5]
MEDDKFYELVELYRNPEHFGKLDKYNYSKESFSPSCGDKFSLYLETKDGKIENASFYGRGCVISTVSLSKLCEFLIGKKIEDVKELNLDSIKKLIGIDEISISRIKCATIGLDALKGLSNP